MSDPRIAELFGRNGWPVAICRAEGEPLGPLVLPTMFYIWVFNHQAVDYEPIACYNTKDEAEKYLALFNKEYKERFKVPHDVSGAVIEATWPEFVEQAVDARLRELAEPLKALLEKSK